MQIAIIGTGIAGNAAAYGLSQGSGHEITLYERETRAGGHSATVDVDYDGRMISVDTGFIVYNELNYPQFTAMLAYLGVATHASDMSFAFSARQGAFEWSGRTTQVFDGLFAQRSNLASPGFLKMLLEVLRFNRLAVADRAAGRLAGLSLADYIALRRFSERFRDTYLVPMGAAIWSMSPAAMLTFPAESFVAFFHNHHLLQWNRPVWRTVTGGSRRYVAALQKPFADRVRLGTAAVRVERGPAGVEVTDRLGQRQRYDAIVLACHCNETLALLAEPTPGEQAILGAIRYRDNAVYLHRDPTLMPVRKRAWAAWNVIEGHDPDADICVSYWMNALQGIEWSKPLFITLNPPEPPHPDLTFARYSYAHPQYDAPAIAAQKRLADIQGRERSWFCGAWTAHGFHEDGLISGIAVAQALGGAFPWRSSPNAPAQAAA
jgi:uncharacterized protein